MIIAISRTDSIGDVILTIPLAGFLKEHYPGCRIVFIGKTYTEAIIRSSSHVDTFINVDTFLKLKEEQQIEELNALGIEWFIHVFPNKQLARVVKKAGIPNRIGTSHRSYHWLTCNKPVSFSRKKSDLHESQLNFKLLAPLGINAIPSLDQMSDYYGMNVNDSVKSDFLKLLTKDRINVILHPKSKGSAREWGLTNFGNLVNILPSEKFRVFISGTKEDGVLMKDWIKTLPDTVEDLTGKLSLDEFISFIGKADALVAASTGPLHIAASLGIKAIGLYPPIRPMHPGRWKPVGKNAHVLVLDKACEDCRKGGSCVCMMAIKPDSVKLLLEK